jgi:hypothetical protein
MNAWQIVLLVVVIVVVLALVAWMAARRQSTARREEQARAHLNEARERQARAESTRAAADEKAAQLRRERAELEQRMAQQERESAELAADAERDQARAAELEERARKLAPHLSTETSTGTAADVEAATPLDRDGDGYPDGTYRDSHAGTGGLFRDSHAGTAVPGTADRYDDSTVRDADAVDARPPATAYRHTAPVTDPGADGAVDDAVDGRHARPDSDADGRPDGSLRERFDGDRGADGTYVDRDTAYQDGTYVDRETVVDRDAGTVHEQTYVDSDGDGVPDDRAGGGGLRRLKDRLTGRVDERDETVEDRDAPGATPRRP